MSQSDHQYGNYNVKFNLGNGDNQLIVETAINYSLSFTFDGFWKTNKGKNKGKDKHSKGVYFIKINMNYYIYNNLFMIFPLHLRIYSRNAQSMEMPLDHRFIKSTIIEFNDFNNIKSFKEHLNCETSSFSSYIKGNAFDLCYDHGEWIHSMEVKAFGGPYRSMPSPFMMTNTIRFHMNKTSRMQFVKALSDLLVIIKQAEHKASLKYEIIKNTKKVKPKKIKDDRFNIKKRRYRKRRRNRKKYKLDCCV